MKILLACPDRDLLKSLAGVLSYEGHGVTAVFDGPQALTEAEDPPQLLVLDPALPGTDVRKLTDRFRAKNVPVLLLSDRPLSEALIREGTADSILEYPFSPAALTERVREMEAEADRPVETFGPERIQAYAFRLEGWLPVLWEELEVLRAMEAGYAAPERCRRICVKTLNEKFGRLGKPCRIGFEAGEGYRWE